MKAICHREGLLAAVQLASAALPARDVAQPILKNIKAVADDGRCTLMATDMEVGIRLDVRGLTIQEPGEAILPAAQLTQILREARRRKNRFPRLLHCQAAHLEPDAQLQVGRHQGTAALVGHGFEVLQNGLGHVASRQGRAG